jgi:RNA polymerase sigma-70 factor, ECF subfamily
MALGQKRAKRYPGTKTASVPACADESCGLIFSQLTCLPDEELMEHLKEGHQDALGILFLRYHRMVYRIALKILRDAAEAEDVTQSVFFEIHRAVERFDRMRGTTRVWVLRYAYHRALNRKHYLSVRGFYSPTDVQALEGLCSSRAGAAGLLTAESACLVRESLATLPEVQREMLELSHFEGLSMAEIAGRKKMSLANVRSHYYRGLNKLRLFLRPRDAAPTRNAEDPSEVAKAVDAKA